jgi:hypothetical protein
MGLRGQATVHSLTRRLFGLGSLALLQVGGVKQGAAQLDEMFIVRIRADETVRGTLPPIIAQNLVIEPDLSSEAREIASRSPPERGGPVILMIVGAIALSQIIQLVNELVRQFYYGGVVIDGRKSPPEISNDPKIPANMVFVFEHDGSVKQFKSGELPVDLLSSVLKVKR